MTDELDARIVRGTELMTTYLNREPGTGSLDMELLRAILGDGLTDDDVIAAQSDMILVAELIMLTYQTMNDVRPIDVLRKIAAHRHTGP